MPGNSVMPLDMRAGIVAAIERGKRQTRLYLNNGSEFAFTLADVTDDALIGVRTATPKVPALVPIAAISMIEFG